MKLETGTLAKWWLNAGFLSYFRLFNKVNLMGNLPEPFFSPTSCAITHVESSSFSITHAHAHVKITINDRSFTFYP